VDDGELFAEPVHVDPQAGQEVCGLADGAAGLFHGGSLPDPEVC
jgi:hypothetical protein